MPVFTNFDSFHMEFILYTSPLLLLPQHTCSHPDCLTHTDSRDGLRKQLCVCVCEYCLYTVHCTPRRGSAVHCTDASTAQTGSTGRRAVTTLK